MRALNTDNMERAQNIREKLQTIDEAVQEIQVRAEDHRNIHSEWRHNTHGTRGSQNADSSAVQSFPLQAAKGSSGNPNSPSLRQAFSKSVALRASLQEAIVQERYDCCGLAKHIAVLRS